MNPLCVPLALISAMFDVAGAVYLARRFYPQAVAAFAVAGLAGAAGLLFYYEILP